MPSEAKQRLLTPPDDSFFLFGPRAVGKSHWLHTNFREALYFDLLDSRIYLELSRNPSMLEAKIGKAPPRSWICIDEIQKIPSLLDEVHRLMEAKGYRFALSGSSARKLKRGGANLLAGRAITRHMEPFSYAELGFPFDLEQILQWGSLPLVVLNPAIAGDILSAYVHTYLKEEIREEGLVRKTEPFVRFLEIAGLLNGQQVNKENIAGEAHIPRSTVDVYFSILVDTLIGHFLPAWRPRAKVREQTHPKFYWFDAGVARSAAGLLNDPVDSLWIGHALETFLYHELRVYNQTQSKNRPIFFYRTGNNTEIDFIIETQKGTPSTKSHVICIEVKQATRWNRSWETPMRSLVATHRADVEKMFGIYRGTEIYSFDGIDILPVTEFLRQLYAGIIF